MTTPLDPYLQILRNEIATTLMPEEDENGRRVAQYSHEILTALWVRSTQLPAIERNTLKQFAELFPRLKVELGSIEGGMILIAELVEHLTVRPNYEQAQTTLQNAVRLLATSTTEESDDLMADIAAINFEGQKVFYEAVKAADIKPSKEQDSDGDLSQQEIVVLQGFLREKFPSDSDLIVSATKVIIGGGSKHTLFIDLLNTVELPSTVVLRIDKSEGVVDSTVVDEYELIQAVYDAGLPAPKPFAIEADPSVMGAPFIILSRIAGHNIGDWNVVFEPSREFAVGMAQALAKLHNMPVTGVCERLPGANISMKARIEAAIGSFENSWRTHGKPSIVMEQAYAWLRAHIDFSEGQRSVLHCDVGCHNMLGENGKLTALLDWETAVIGNPAQDLTYTENTVKQMMPWDEYLAEYEKAGGTLPSQEQMDFYRMWRSCFRIHYQFMARSFFFAGLSSSMVHAYASQRLYLEAEKDIHENVKTMYSRYKQQGGV